ncbi:8955_t:CDS:2 [Diversispora eburnea]|uniref:8955_t:CDS:1 n=1 Tax=Diversispora eburnea TaxID=1213867 RepID=A0A9N8WL51_9GLOM|nr:8955_t:CDS:2 [Diversispora eburnea]
MTNNEFQEDDQGKQSCSNNIRSDATIKHTTLTEEKDEVSMERNNEKDAKMTNNEFQEGDQGKQCCSDNIKSDTTSKHTTVTEEKDEAGAPVSETLASETLASEIPASETPVSEASSNAAPGTQINTVTDPDLDFHEPGPREEDEDKLYDPSRPITHRIETAIQKYKKNRKFSSTRNQVFSSYLRFGGVSTGQRAFQGQDGIDNADADADEITIRRATDFIELDEEEVEVDFTYIAEVYLSSYLIDKSGYVQIEQFREGPQVVMSFLNYLIQHEVCPEYLDDMKKALEIAKRAKNELPNCKYLAQLAPGQFNKACSLLYGGELHSLFDDPWDGEESVAKLIGISPAESEKIAISVFGDKALELKQLRKKSLISFEVEILDIEPIQESNTSEIDTKTSNTEDSKTDNIKKNEISPQNLRKMTVRPHKNEKEEPFFIHLSPDVANYPMPGMLVTADFYQLSNDWWYWDRVTNVYPSYYTPVEESDYEDD